tara:strand:+ start:350 stop:568 length:219 start_codon:yes stop_codon:yes gene_type:complete
MTDIKQIDSDVNEYLQYCSIDFDLPLVETKFQIFNELIILFQLDKTNLSEEQECLKYYLKNYLNTELNKLFR